MGNSCIQNIDKTYGDFVGLDMLNPQSPLSEDCLFINIWVPRRTAAAENATSSTASAQSRKAVMVQTVYYYYQNLKPCQHWRL